MSEVVDHNPTLVKLGALANSQQLLLAPCVDTLTLCTGWNDETTDCLKKAIAAVLQGNPVLTGTLARRSISLSTTRNRKLTQH